VDAALSKFLSQQPDIAELDIAAEYKADDGRTPTEPFCLLTTKDAARILGLSPAMLERLRWMREGPPFVRPTGTGRAVRYRWRDLVDWIERNRVDPDKARE
jgi:hypothetical protein